MKSLYHRNLSSPVWPALWKKLLLQGLEDDGWPWDWTGSSVAWKPLRARLMAKASGIWAGETLVKAVERVAPEIGEMSPFRARSRKKDGQMIKPGDWVATFEGPAPLVLALERPFINLASFASGIASQTFEMVERVRKACPKRTPRVTSTRKILPFYRDLSLFSVQVGGGYCHRTDLASGVLIKENHVASLGGVAKSIEATRARAPHTLKIEIEVRSLAELKQALKARADIIMLDNFNPDQVREALSAVDAFAGLRPWIEVSGGLTLESIHRYAIPGVDVLSVGGLTHSVKALDLSLLALPVK